MGMTRTRGHFDLLQVQRGILQIDSIARADAATPLTVLGTRYDGAVLGMEGVADMFAYAQQNRGQASLVVRGMPNVAYGDSTEVRGTLDPHATVMSQVKQEGIYLFQTEGKDGSKIGGSVEVVHTPHGMTALHVEVPSAAGIYEESTSPVSKSGIDVV